VQAANVRARQPGPATTAGPLPSGELTSVADTHPWPPLTKSASEPLFGHYHEQPSLCMRGGGGMPVWPWSTSVGSGAPSPSGTSQAPAASTIGLDLVLQ